MLISVRNAEEARAALAGGCDVLDVKEPRRGSLGMADPATIDDVLRSVRASVPVSAALGELREWIGSQSAALPASPLDYAKVGLAGMQAASNWTADWLAFRRRVDDRHPPRNWVAVAYADWRPAEAPAPDDVVSAAIDTGCAAVLIDTCAKTGRRLLDWLSPEALAAIAERLRRHGLQLALAGSLTAADLPRLVPLAPDVIAIRTAACSGDDRIAHICADRVATFRAALQAAKAFGTGSP